MIDILSLGSPHNSVIGHELHMVSVRGSITLIISRNFDLDCFATMVAFLFPVPLEMDGTLPSDIYSLRVRISQTLY